MARILIVYESRYGQTEKIASFILDRLQSRGHSGDIQNLSNLEIVDPAKYDGIIVGAGIYGRRYPSVVQKWVKKNSQVLSGKPSAFFSVCLAILQKDEKVLKSTREVEENFLKKNSWSPRLHTIFAGALSYSKYNWVVKQMMRLISKAGGGETDVSRDHEYTNWSDVTRFADDFANFLPAGKERGAELFP